MKELDIKNEISKSKEIALNFKEMLKELEDFLKMSESTMLNTLSLKNEFINDIIEYYKDKEHTLYLFIFGNK